jgi:hypothetical protein
LCAFVAFAILEKNFLLSEISSREGRSIPSAVHHGWRCESLDFFSVLVQHAQASRYNDLPMEAWTRQYTPTSVFKKH